MIIKLFVDAGDAKPGPPLGPILGQYQIDINSFCKDFNEKTKSFLKGVPLPISIIKAGSGKNYILNVKKPTVCFLVRQFLVASDSNSRIITRVDAYNILRILAVLHAKSLSVTSNDLFSTFSSMKILIK